MRFESAPPPFCLNSEVLSGGRRLARPAGPRMLREGRLLEKEKPRGQSRTREAGTAEGESGDHTT